MRYSKYQKLVKMVSYDNGQTWEVSSPIEYSVGDLIETNSPDCGYQPIYRWTTIEDDFVCVGTTKCAKEVRQVSYDDGETWENVEPLETRTGPSIEANSFDCGYIEYRWEPVENEFYCENDNKYNKLVYQQTTDGTNWTDVEPAEYQKGELIEYNSDDCGWTEEEIANFYNEKGLEVPTYDDLYVKCRCGTFTVGSAKLLSPTRLKLTITPDWNKTYMDQCGTKFYFLRYNTPFYSSPAIPTAVKDTSNFTLSYQLNKEPLNNNEGYYTFMLKLDNPSSSATDGANTTIKVYKIMQEQKSDNASEYEELYSMPFFAINKDNEVFFTEVIYRWITIDDYICDDTTKYEKKQKQYSYNGTTWEDVEPAEYDKGDVIEENSTDCGYVDNRSCFDIKVGVDNNQTMRLNGDFIYVQTSDKVGTYCIDEATELTSLFTFCNLNSNIYNVNFSDNFDTSKVTTMSQAFAKTNITTIDLSMFDTSSLTDISNMFYQCTSLTTVYLDKFDPDTIIYKSGMFYLASKVKNIRCTQKFKDFCLTNQYDMNIPNNINWEIVS